MFPGSFHILETNRLGHQGRTFSKISHLNVFYKCLLCERVIALKRIFLTIIITNFSFQIHQSFGKCLIYIIYKTSKVQIRF